MSTACGERREGGCAALINTEIGFAGIPYVWWSKADAWSRDAVTPCERWSIVT